MLRVPVLGLCSFRLHGVLGPTKRGAKVVANGRDLRDERAAAHPRTSCWRRLAAPRRHEGASTVVLANRLANNMQRSCTVLLSARSRKTVSGRKVRRGLKSLPLRLSRETDVCPMGRLPVE